MSRSMLTHRLSTNFLKYCRDMSESEKAIETRLNADIQLTLLSTYPDYQMQFMKQVREGI